MLDDLTGWIEMHIEQARVLQDTGNRIGIVDRDRRLRPRRRRRATAAATTPARRRWTSASIRRCRSPRRSLELERLARAAGQGTVGTVGEIEVDPGLINAIASRVRFSLDIRGPDDDAYRGVARDIAAFAQEAARAARDDAPSYRERQTLPATPMDERIVGALEQAAARDRRAVHDDALGRGARHDVRRRPRPERDGLRPLQGRDQPPPGRGRRARRTRRWRPRSS